MKLSGFKMVIRDKTRTLILVAIGLFVAIVGYFTWHVPAASPSSSRDILYWVDAMEPQIHYERPGKSRMNMELVPVYEEDKPNSKKEIQPTIEISPAIINNLGVRTATVEEGPLSLNVKAFGVVKADEDKVVHIHSYVEGWVQKLYTKKAQELVEQGQPLFEIYSRDLRLAQREYLLSAKGNSHPDDENAIAKLRSLGVSEKQIEELKKTKQSKPWVTIYAPKKGYIDTLNIREGMWVRPETTIMSLTDPSEVWVIAEVFPAQLPLIRVGQSVTVALPHYPRQRWKGTVDYIYPEIDSVSLTAKVRIRLSNTHLFLKPNMSIAVNIQHPLKTRIKVPKEAIIWEEGGQHVVVALEGGKFQPRKVVTGIEGESDIEIVSGLKPGERVVTSAQFLLDSEVNMKSALKRLETPPPAPQDHSHMAGHGS